MPRDHENYEYVIPKEIGVEFAVPKKEGLSMFGLNPPGFLTGQEKSIPIKYTPEEIKILGKGGLTKAVHLVKSVFEDSEIIGKDPFNRASDLYKE